MKTATKNGSGNSTFDVLSNVSNDGEFAISTSVPYRVEVEITGNSDFLFHRWSCDEVEAKAKAAKGSAAKKSDNLESYVYRCDDGTLGIPGEYLRQAIAGKNGAAKYRQDPRSARKSALDLFKAGVVSLTEVASLGVEDWDRVDRRRVCIQASSITRERPAMRTGWKVTFILMVLVPEYISPSILADVIADAGRLVGVGDFRPTYGRFAMTRFEVLKD